MKADVLPIKASWHMTEHFAVFQVHPPYILIRTQTPLVDLACIHFNMTDTVVNTRVRAVNLAIFFHSPKQLVWGSSPVKVNFAHLLSPFCHPHARPYFEFAQQNSQPSPLPNICQIKPSAYDRPSLPADH
jgi:hypothetical protein